MLATILMLIGAPGGHAISGHRVTVHIANVGTSAAKCLYIVCA